MEFENEDVGNLHIAASQGMNKIVDKLLSEETDVDYATNLGWTPLMCAARNGHLNVVIQLVNRGANIFHTNKLGANVLSMAVASGHKDVIELLLMNMKESQLSSLDNLLFPFFIAILNGHLDIIHLFINKYKDLINASDKYGISPLMVAAVGDKVDVLSFLISNGAESNRKNVCHNSALDIALITKHEKIERVLKEQTKLEDMCSLVECKSLRSDLIETYGWSFNKSIPDEQMTQQSRQVFSPFVGSSSSHHIVPSSIPNVNSSFFYQMKGNTLPNIQINFPTKTSNECNSPMCVPVPPLSPYSNHLMPSFIFPIENQVHTSLKNVPPRGTLEQSCLLNSKCKCKCNRHINQKCKMYRNIDMSNFVSPHKNTELNITQSLSKKKKMKLWWNKSTTGRLKNFFTTKQKIQSDNEENTNLVQPSSDNPFLKDEKISGKEEVNFSSDTAWDKLTTIPLKSSVPDLLKNLDLDNCIPMFIEHEIDMESFVLLNKRDFQEMGIKCTKIQEKLLRTIALLKDYK